MSPLVLDLLYLALAVGLLAGGWQQGFVRSAASLIAFGLSIGLSVWGIDFLQNTWQLNVLNNPLGVVGAFLVLTLVINWVLGLAVWILDAIRKLLSFIPLVGLLNSIGGLLIGAVQLALVTGFFGWLLTMLPPAQKELVPVDSQAVILSEIIYVNILRVWF